MDLFELFDRWLHFASGALWIGLLFYLNGIQGRFVERLDEDTQRRVLPELVPRTLAWFRWGAAFTWMTGFLLLFLVYYHGYDGANLFDGQHPPPTGADWGPGLLGVLLGYFVYDQLFARLPRGMHWLAALVWAALVVGFGGFLREVQGFSARATYVHVGALLGTVMAANAWLRIGPAQKRVLAALAAGTAAPEADARLVAERTHHNALLSVPVLLWMVGVHQDALLSRDTVPALAVTLLLGSGLAWIGFRLARRAA